MADFGLERSAADRVIEKEWTFCPINWGCKYVFEADERQYTFCQQRVKHML